MPVNQENFMDNNDVFNMIHEFAKSKVKVYVCEWSNTLDKDDLAWDFGIYGRLAVGYLTPCPDGTTQQFEMYFSNDQIELTFDRFSNLLRFSTKESTKRYFKIHGEDYEPEEIIPNKALNRKW